MRFEALACDFDATMADHGYVSDAVLVALEGVRASGRRLVVVTGRRLHDVLALLPDPELFVAVVAENGAVSYLPDYGEERRLVPPVPPHLVDGLRASGIRVEVGRSIVSTSAREQETVERVLGYLGLDYRCSRNRGSLMIVPAGLDKAVGLRSAAEESGLVLHRVVAVGDAENDVPLLSVCGCGVAVANAVDEVKAVADVVLDSSDGEGVAALARALVADDLMSLLGRRHPSLADQGPERAPPGPQR